MPNTPGLHSTQVQQPVCGCKHGREDCAVCPEKRGARVISSEELLGGGRQLFIVHKGQVYRLILTRNDKLILQK
jgi:hemin uptake protein HemP